MALNPALREMVTAATAKYKGAEQIGRGIIPLEPVDPYEELVARVAGRISEALTGPAIGARELAEEIVEEMWNNYE